MFDGGSALVVVYESAMCASSITHTRESSRMSLAEKA